MIKIKRIYDPPGPGDGRRIFIDRLWPRGMKKEDAHIDGWLKDAAPSDELREWFGHDPGKWGDFKRRYYAELKTKKELVDGIVDETQRGTVTLLFSSRELRYNNAVALKDYIEVRIQAATGKRAA